MPPSKIENYLENRENQNTVDPSAQQALNTFTKGNNFRKLKEALEKTLADLDAQAKSELQTKYLAELKKVKSLDLQVFLKTKLLAGLPTLTPQEEIWYSQLYFLAKSSLPDNAEVTSEQILQQVDYLWELNYSKFGNSRAVRNKNPGNLRMNGDEGKDKG